MPLKHKVILPFFLIFFCHCVTKPADEKTIGIQLFNAFSSSDLEAIEDAVKSTFDCKIYVLEQIKIPKSHITRVKSFRYRADSILNLLDRSRIDTIDILLGLTSTDIAITKKNRKTGKTKKPVSTYTDWAIFGLGRINGTSCVVSNFRLKKGVTHRKYLTRLTRICNHEIGHVLGLPHCPEESCLMNDANETISTIDRSSGRLCGSCQNQIN